MVATHVPVDLRSLAAEVPDISKLLARVGDRTGYLDGDDPVETPAIDPPPVTLQPCRLAVVHGSAWVIPKPA
ncbi:hypothetical protein [Nannocystis sp.]|uniref:hypothetical protein n=1 Tax=Nannocystis sp. TaxID=1962667 RepID=UPI0025F8C406|nr:hypothetical protein [Nannocystis sp.]MBK7829749.1 hypothetical protein [Nannocystis sp.]